MEQPEALSSPISDLQKCQTKNFPCACFFLQICAFDASREERMVVIGAHGAPPTKMIRRFWKEKMFSAFGLFITGAGDAQVQILLCFFCLYVCSLLFLLFTHISCLHLSGGVYFSVV